MEVHWWTYNRCLFVSYLTSVTFGYGWTLDTKFLKFLRSATTCVQPPRGRLLVRASRYISDF